MVLQPPQENDIIECNIINTTLNMTEESQNELEESEYEALSYTWGSPNVMRVISIDEQTCSIRENLWLALYYLRLNDKSGVLWIDALCIDQNDIRERNHQVARMDKVFKHAGRVLVWLGPDTARDRKALELIRLSNDFQLSLRSAGGHSQFYNSPEAPAWQAVIILCQRVYWTRLWIIQEVFFTAKIILYCGDSSCDWEHLEKLCSFADYAKTTEFTVFFPNGDQIIESIPYRLNRQR